MPSRITRLRLAVVAFAVLPLGACAAKAPVTSDVPVYRSEGFAIIDEDLRRSVEKLETQSPSFKAAMDEIRATNVMIDVASYDAMQRRWPSMMPKTRHKLYGYTLWSQDSTGTATAAWVGINTRRLRSDHNPAKHPEKYEAALEMVLIHELYGHVAPVVKTGKLADQCRDPKTRRESMDSCVMKRENQINQELGRPIRTNYWQSDF